MAQACPRPTGALDELVWAFEAARVSRAERRLADARLPAASAPSCIDRHTRNGSELARIGHQGLRSWRVRSRARAGPSEMRSRHYGLSEGQVSATENGPGAR